MPILASPSLRSRLPIKASLRILLPNNASPLLRSLLPIIASLRIIMPYIASLMPFIASLRTIMPFIASLRTIMPFIASPQTIMPILLHSKYFRRHCFTPNTYADIASLRIHSFRHPRLTDHQASLIFSNPTILMVSFNMTTLMVFFLLSDSPSIHLRRSFRLTTLMVFFNPTILMVFFNMTNRVLFFNTHHSTVTNSHGELVSPSLLLSRYSYGEFVSPSLTKSKPLMGRLCLPSLLLLNSYGETVSPFLIESAVSDYLPEDSSFTEGSVNLELLLVLFPVLFICFQMSLHVHRLKRLSIYLCHYLFSESGLSWLLSRRFGGSLFVRTIIRMSFCVNFHHYIPE